MFFESFFESFAKRTEVGEQRILFKGVFVMKIFKSVVGSSGYSTMNLYRNSYDTWHSFVVFFVGLILSLVIGVGIFVLYGLRC